jgi:hypothetical protein
MKAENALRDSRWRSTTRHCGVATATSKTDFARSTAMILDCIGGLVLRLGQ